MENSHHDLSSAGIQELRDCFPEFVNGLHNWQQGFEEMVTSW
jgi:hypothetical protein